MRLAANDDKLTPTVAFSMHTRDDRLERARKLLRPTRASGKPRTGPILASAGLAGAALLLASLITGVPGSHSDAPKVPTSGSDLAPSTPKADFELSASPETTPQGSTLQGPAQQAGTPAVRDAVLIGTEGESH